jgi:ketosteroid isomerase-like protein
MSIAIARSPTWGSRRKPAPPDREVGSVSERNVEWVRSVYAARDPLAVLQGGAAPDVEVDLSAVYPDRPLLRGIEDVRRFREATWGESQRFEAERYFDVDDERVLVFVRGTATGPGSGAPVVARTAHEFTMRHGLLVRFKVYADRAQALDAAGLRE